MGLEKSNKLTTEGGEHNCILILKGLQYSDLICGSED